MVNSLKKWYNISVSTIPNNQDQRTVVCKREIREDRETKKCAFIFSNVNDMC